jgi:putative NADH-flavin reductase
MKIAILGATGRVGSRIVDEALRRGHAVTAMARHASAFPARDRLITRDIDAADGPAMVETIAGHDAMVSAMPFRQVDPEALVSLTKKAGVPRLMVVGGSGSLFVAPGVQLIDTPDFPAAYKLEAAAGRDFLGVLNQEVELDWTFLSPSALLEPGERTGTYRLGKDELLTDASGKSWISMEDYAIALVDELERPAHSRQRFTVGY